MLLDTGAGISDVVLYTVSLAGEVLVVVTPEPTSLTDAYATIKVLATTQGRRKSNLLVNQTRKLGEGRVGTRQQLQQVIDRYVNPRWLDSPACLRLELLGECRPTAAVRESVQRRQLLMELQPGCTGGAGHHRHQGGRAPDGLSEERRPRRHHRLRTASAASRPCARWSTASTT